MFLIDSNIIIFALHGKEDALSFLAALGKAQYAISVVTRLEVLLGADKHRHSQEFLEDALDDYENIDMDRVIVREAVQLQQRMESKLKFKDLIIAATARVYGKTLVTADKDFLKLKGVKVKLYA